MINNKTETNTETLIIQEHQSPHPHHILGGWRFKTVLLTILFSVIGYLLFTLWGGWHNVVAAVTHVGLLGIGLALFLSLVNYGLRFLRWQLFLKTLGYSVPWKPSLRIYMAGFSLTTTPGKAGEALRGVFLKDFGVPFRKTFGAFLSERFCDLISVSILTIGGLWKYPQSHSILLFVASVFALLLFFIQKTSWIKALERLSKRLLPDSLAHTIEFSLETIFAFRDCFRPRILFPAIILGVLAWTAEALALYALLHMLGYQVELISAMFIYGFSLVIGGVTLLPGGLGGAEVTMLNLLIIHGVDPSVAVALTLVVRLTTLWFSVVLGFIALPKKQILWQTNR